MGDAGSGCIGDDMRPRFEVPTVGDGRLSLQRTWGLEDFLHDHEQALHFADIVLQALPTPLIVLDEELRVQKANRVFYETFGLVPSEAEQVHIYKLRGGDWNVSVLRRLLDQTLQRHVGFGDFEVIHEFDRIGRRTMLVDACAVTLDALNKNFILLTLEDISEWQLEGDKALLQQAASMDASMDGIALHDADGVFIYANKAHAGIYGYNDPNELIGKHWKILYDETEANRFDSEVMPLFEREGQWRGEGVAKRMDGTRFPQELSLSKIAGGGLVCVVRDITERIRQQESFARLAEIVENAADSIISLDFDGNIQTWNKAAEKLYGYTAQEMIGKPLISFTCADHIAAVNKYLDAPKHGQAVDFETRRICKNGREIDVSVRFSPIRDAHGKLIGASTIGRDVTQQKRQEEIKGRLAAIVESSEDAIYSTDFNDMVTSWNKSAERLFGFSVDEAIGKNISIIYPPAMEAQERAKLRYNGGNRVRQFDTVRRHKDGTLLDVSMHVSPIINPRGEVIGLSRIARDISERKRVEMDRTREAQRSKLLADAAHNLLSSKSPERIVREIFAQVGPELGVEIYLNYMVSRSGDVLELNSHAGISEEVARQIRVFPFGRAVCGAVAKQRRPWIISHAEIIRDRELELLRAEHISAYACNPLVASGKLIGTLSFASRVREQFSPQDVEYLRTICDFVALAQERALYQQTLEERVQERTAKLRESIGELEAFSYSVTHDMRAPLRAMRSFARILLADYKNELKGEGAEFLERISDAAEHMDELIQDVLTYTRIVRAEVKIEHVDLDKLVRNVIATYPHLAAKAGCVKIVDRLPVVLGNTASLTQCVSNLLGNAVKFVPPGLEPQVRVWSEDAGPKVKVWFEDNGIGIDPKLLDRIFGIFERGTQEPEYEGTGIGLAIVKKAVERIGGSVGVESTLGKGSRFWIQLRKA
jgi:PAS domain S-box-containing protein